MFDTEEQKEPVVEQTPEKSEAQKSPPTIKELLLQQAKVNQRVESDRREQLIKQLTEKPTRRKKVTVK